MTRWNSVDSLLADAVGVVFPSAQLVVTDAGEVVLDRAVGAAHEGTWFDLASLTKALCTTTLAMRLVERGALRLDDEPRPGVTVRHLLCHASGLPAWKPLAPPIVDAARTEPLEAPPGTRSVYSDLGFILLGDAIARSGGAPLDALFDVEVARPLGVALRFGPVEPSRAAPCEGLRGVVHDENARTAGGISGHAGLFGTARDVARVASALVSAWHGRPSLVAPETVRAFWQPCGVPGSTWCLGWDSPSPQGSQAGTAWPKTGVGHLGFTGCSLWIDPPRSRSVVLLSNRVEPTRTNERIKQLRPALHDAIASALGV